MYDDYNGDEDYAKMTMTFREKIGETHTFVEKIIGDAGYYPNIVEQFVYFLQAAGFSYIAGIQVLDADGEIIHSTDL